MTSEGITMTAKGSECQSRNPKGERDAGFVVGGVGSGAKVGHPRPGGRVHDDY